ncbi:hypothetical protein BH11PSE8_BH11PSE8_04300 [soil metagenome]
MIDSTDNDDSAAHADIFVGHSEMAELMRRHDWASTSLGPPERWPEALKVALRILLTSRFDMWLGWGPEVHFFYNDAYRPTLGDKHPRSLAMPTRVLWSEIWDQIKDRIETVYRDGTSTWDRALLLMLERSGYTEETYHTFSYSPLIGDTGRVEGLFCAVSEETERVLSERRLATLSTLASGLAASDSRARVMAATEQALGAAARELPFTLVYLFDADAHAEPVDDHATARGPNLHEPAGITPVAQLFAASGMPAGHHLAPQRLTEEAASRWGAGQILAGAAELQVDLAEPGLDIPSGAWDEPPLHATVLALGGQGGEQPVGFLVVARNRYRPLDADGRNFVRLIAGQIGSALANADAYEAQRRRAAELAEAIQMRQEAAEVLRRANQRLSAEVEARTAEGDRLRRLFAQAPGFMCVLGGPDHTFELINDSYQRLVGHRDVAGKRLRDALPELVGQGFLGLLNEVLRTGTPYIGRGVRVMLQREPGAPLDERFLNFIYQPIFAPDGSVDGIFAEGNDATEQVRAERALLELNNSLEARIGERTNELAAALDRLKAESAEREAVQEALRQSQKMEAVGQLTGGIAHDFNNLLQGITGSLTLVRRRLAQGRVAEVDRFVVDAGNSAKRAAALTHRLLAFSRRQPLAPKPLLANPLVASMQDLLARTLGERISLTFSLSDGLWTTLCDANQLESALLNLCINARDAMPNGGALRIATDNIDLHPDHAARDPDVLPGQYVCIAVTDTGSGMPPDVQARAFDPFFTTKPIGQGTGLGLSMIYGFARQSEGHAKIHSEVGQGTTVRLFLPRHTAGTPSEATSVPTSDDAQRAAPGQAPNNEPARAVASELAAGHAIGSVPSPPRVLLIEDEAVVRSLVVEALSDLGCVTIEAADGPSGLQVLMSAQTIDLLVTDIGLPGLDGRQVADAARSRRPGLKVLLMTGYAENANFGDSVLGDGMGLIIKPFAMDDLAARLRGILHSA